MEASRLEGQADVRALVTALVSLVSKHTIQDPHETQSPTGTRVILDLEVRDVRCVLSRVPQPTTPASPRLSRRQLEIATMIAGGGTNKEIASALHISEWTVSTHVRHMFAKLGVSTRAAMVARLLETRGLVAGGARGSYE